jgi:hypothetical protein
MQTLYRLDLDDAQCSNPACPRPLHEHGPVYLDQACHPDAGLDVYYLDGELFLRCKQCALPVAQIAVKERPEG